MASIVSFHPQKGLNPAGGKKHVPKTFKKQENGAAEKTRTSTGY